MFCSANMLFAYDNGVVPINTPESAKRLINDLMETYGKKYPLGAEFLQRLEKIDPKNQTALDALIREVALANPAIDFDKILCVRRKPQKGQLGFTALNAYTEDTIPRSGWDNEICILSHLRGEPKLTRIPKKTTENFWRERIQTQKKCKQLPLKKFKNF
jgi:hypothetical protein